MKDAKTELENREVIVLGERCAIVRRTFMDIGKLGRQEADFDGENTGSSLYLMEYKLINDELRGTTQYPIRTILDRESGDYVGSLEMKLDKSGPMYVEITFVYGVNRDIYYDDICLTLSKYIPNFIDPAPHHTEFSVK